MPKASFERSEKEKRSLRERIHVKAVDKAVDIFQGELQWEGKRVSPERAKDILYAFLERQLATASMFRSEKYDASFLYAEVDAASIAKLLYEQYSGAPAPSGAPAQPTEQEFIFGSYTSPYVPGALFTFFEQGLQEVLHDLPEALEDLKNGKEPRYLPIYFVGSPTRDIGHISPAFAAAVKEKGAFATCADIYAEFIHSVSKGDASIKLRGVSMGASFAVKTADTLRASGQVTQSPEEAASSKKHFMEVRLDTPVAQTTFSKTRRWLQMRSGFIAHSLWTLATDPYVRATSSPFSRFMRDVSPILEEKGIAADMSREQARLKKETTRALIAEMDAGIPVPKDMRVTEVIGLLDILTLSPKQSLGGLVKALSEKLRSSGSADTSVDGSVLVSEKGNRRRLGIVRGHNFPNFPPSTIENLYRSDVALQKLKEGK